MKEVVCFFLKDREFGVDVSQMKTIANTVNLQPRDGLPEFVKGIVDIHGEQIPLVDVDQLLKIPDNQVRKENKVVVFISECGSFAVECDGISEIVSVEDRDVQGVPGFFYKNETDYADCVIKKKNNALVLVMNPDRMMNGVQFSALKRLIDKIEEERLEAERKRIEEERKRKEEEKRRREEEMAKLEEESRNKSESKDDSKEDQNE